MPSYSIILLILFLQHVYCEPYTIFFVCIKYPVYIIQERRTHEILYPIMQCVQLDLLGHFILILHFECSHCHNPLYKTFIIAYCILFHMLFVKMFGNIEYIMCSMQLFNDKTFHPSKPNVDETELSFHFKQKYFINWYWMYSFFSVKLTLSSI